MREIVLDIETTMDASKIWCAVTKDLSTNEVNVWTEAEGLQNYLAEESILIGHNLIGFDVPVLKRLWNLKTDIHQLKDTLVMSRLEEPTRENGHSLKAWGQRLGNYKQEFTDFNGGLTDEMVEYCKQDVEVTGQLYQRISNDLLDWGCSVDLEHSVAAIIKEQQETGFKLDVRKVMSFLVEWKKRLGEIEEELQQVFRPIVTERYSEKTGNKLKDKVEIFNPGSRKQIAERLMSLGWKPKKYTEKGSVIVDEKVLSTIKIPEAKLIEEYLLLQKRVAQVESWLDHADRNDRVHGQVRTNGAVTGRMTHNDPNMAQVPRVGTPYGKECRSCWIADEGKVLVGIDASGLELRMLAHYMQDEEYIKEVCEGDIHTKNMKAAGLTDRNLAKTFIYALLYGCSSAKMGSILGVSEREGGDIINRFLKNTPALITLRQKVERLSKKGWLPGLDGRRLHIRSQHAALNTLLQGAGAVVMKQALICLHKKLNCGIMDARFVANIHDEWQIETTKELAESVGQFGIQAIQEAGHLLKLRCPLDGDFKIGANWAETH